MARSSGQPCLRYRLTVPETDVDVVAWLAAQTELSLALRLLIKRDISENGISNVTCRSVQTQRKEMVQPVAEESKSDSEESPKEVFMKLKPGVNVEKEAASLFSGGNTGFVKKPLSALDSGLLD